MRQETLTDLETTVTDDTVPMAFNLSNSVIIKLPMFPAPITAKERKTISLFVCERSPGDLSLMGRARASI